MHCNNIVVDIYRYQYSLRDTNALNFGYYSDTMDIVQYMLIFLCICISGNLDYIRHWFALINAGELV